MSECESIQEESVTDPARNLATVQQVLALDAIPGKDRIEMATVLGYKVIVKKGLEVGDFGVFFEVDSVLDTTDPRFSFLKSPHIKTMKMNGFYSQGLFLPLEEVVTNAWELSEGDDLTAVLGVEKYAPPVNETRRASRTRPWPSWAPPKTDELRLQSNPGLLDAILESEDGWYVTQKLDGSSMTVGMVDGVLRTCSRNLEVEDGPFFEFSKTLPPFTEGYVFQGELCGPGIQKNPLGLTKKEFFVFNVFFEGEELNYEASRNAIRHFGLKCVPTVIEPLPVGNDYSLDNLIKFSEALSYPTGKPAEGIVIRPVTPGTYNHRGQNIRLSAKIINPLYELNQ